MKITKTALFSLLVLLALFTLVSCAGPGSYSWHIKSSVIFTDDLENYTKKMEHEGFTAIGRVSFSASGRDDAERRLLELCRQQGASVAACRMETVDFEPVFRPYTGTYYGRNFSASISFPVLSGVVFTFGTAPSVDMVCTAVLFAGPRY